MLFKYVLLLHRNSCTLTCSFCTFMSCFPINLNKGEQMKHLMILIVMVFFTGLFAQQKLEIGMKAPDWSFTDADGKTFTMESWAGKVIQVNYVDPDETEMNEPFNEAVKKAIDVDSLISRDKFKGFGIVDCAATWKPDALIRIIAGKKAKKFNTTILFDYDAKLRKSWNLKEDSYNVIILDKNRVVKALYKGEIPKADYSKMIKLIAELQDQ